MQVTLPDGNVLELEAGATGLDAALAIGPGLAKAALAIKQEGEVRDLSAPLVEAPIEIVTERSGQDALDLIRHDAAHVFAAAMLELHPGVKITIGPPIAGGFYYDVEMPEGTVLSDADFPAIEKQMKQHVKADEQFVREDVPVEAGRARFEAEGQSYKVELIDDLVASQGIDTVSLYTNGPFTDLCRGPHAPSTKRIKAFKLQSVAGAYWRGDASRTMLTRVYGTAFFSKADLAEHLERIEEAKKRDHRRLGPQLGLFEFSPVAQGAAFWLPRGTTVFNELVKLSREMGEPRGYSEVKTPQLYDAELWRTSGHWGKYKENMFLTESEDSEMALKPMNCPGHAQLFKTQQWSYRDLPVRYSEPGLLHRNELSGALHGLLRVRHFAQDDAHVFCTEEQVPQEVAACLEFAFATYGVFGFENITVELSTRPENRIGTDEFWDMTEGVLRTVLEEQGIDYVVNEGDGAFYAPKIDLQYADSLGRSWQIGTVQLDYNMPERFGLSYIGADNAEHRPVMIHRALMGSYERFIGILIEDTAGELPLWLSPVQAIVLPISDRHLEAAQLVRSQLTAAGLRSEVDERTESVGRKIRDAELRKVPYMLVVGDREAEDGTVAVRRHREGDEGTEAVADFAARIGADVLARSR